MSLEDRLAIGDLFVRYATALDRGDVETVVDCFTDDAALESPVIGVIAGREAIRGFSERFAAQRAGGMQFRHMITNIAAEVERDRGRSRLSRGAAEGLEPWQDLLGQHREGLVAERRA